MALIGSQDAVAEIRETSQAQLEEMVGKVEEMSLHADAITGTPFLELLRLVKETSADLLVLESNGSSDPLKGAEHIVRESPCSGFAVKPDGFQYDID